MRHESPQVLVLRDGRMAWHAAHRRVTERAVAFAVAATQRGAGDPG